MFPDTPPASSTYTVTEVTARVRSLLESDSALQSVWVGGEVSNMTQAASGHWYFTLKDAKTQLKCVMWRSSASKQSVVPRDGDQIEAHGYVGVYEPRGEYQLYADRVRPVGLGDLYLRFEELKARLAAEGLFDAERKRPLPVLPQRIGVVTSPDAAAFQDVQNVLRRRYPLAEIILSATQVQGADAPPQIVRALERLYTRGTVEVILLIRGGGSIEDLWCFNDERVARAVAASPVPVVSGVGHEIDFTIVDFVADLRAPTPSAAAEMATPHIDALREAVGRAEAQMTAALRAGLTQRADALAERQQVMRYASPLAQVRTLRQRVDGLAGRMTLREQGRLALLRERLAARAAALEAANPAALLARGYAIVRGADGRVLRSVHSARPGDRLRVQLHDGELRARVEQAARLPTDPPDEDTPDERPEQRPLF